MTTDDVVAVSLPALQRVSSVEAVMQVVREQVFAGALAAGVPLREAALSEQLNVSRHTLRVALSNLAHEGVVRLEANRGAFVRELVPADVEDCYRLRELLELTAVEAVTGNTELLRPARHAMQEMVRLGSESSWSLSREADLEFHRQIVAALGSSRILHAYESLLTDLRLCFLVEGFNQKDQLTNAAEHAALLEAIEGPDTAYAVSLMRTHLQTSRLEALRALDSNSSSLRRL
jgi:DNA-binding GntR family transcriptional regulator